MIDFNNPEQQTEIIDILKARFIKNMNRHEGVGWAEVQARLEANKENLRSLYEMERTGGEPDVILNKDTGELAFYDYSAESPKERRSLCYDREALNSRKENKPRTSAVDMAAEMGIELLTEEQYRLLQTFEALTQRHQAGLRHRKASGSWVGPYSVTAAMTRYLYITTALSPITPQEAFGACW